MASHPLHSHILTLNHHPVTVQCYPIGVNPELIQKIAQQNSKNSSTVFEFDELSDQQTIISVDRIDYSKGLIERFDALEAFLQSNPEYHKHLTDLQIACPCRMEIKAYQELYEDMQSKVDLINQEFSQDNWLPINCTHDAISHDELMKIYRQANICWVNSLRDGMNLVAKEFIAAQNPEDPGVLILSKYTGAAEQMSEALIVDPENCDSMIKGLKTALTMSKSERIERYEYLMNGLKRFDINDWRNAFLDDLRGVKKIDIIPSIAKKIHPKIVNY